MLTKNDISVTLFLDLEGVRLADKNQPQNLARVQVIQLTSYTWLI